MPEMNNILTGVALVLAVWLSARYVSALLQPYLIARDRWPMHSHHLPEKLRHLFREAGVRTYFANLPLGDYAFAGYIWGRRVVVVDYTFWSFAANPLLEFVLAHELGHHAHGHPWRTRLLATLGILPWCRDCAKRIEDQANIYAERITGYPVSIVWGYQIRKAAPGGSGQNEEKTA